MPADFEREVTDRLSLLRTDLDKVTWADGATIRRRGHQRQVRRAATTGAAVVTVVGALGYSAIVGLPHDPVTLATRYLQSSSADRTAVTSPGGTTESSERSPTDSERTSDRSSSTRASGVAVPAPHPTRPGSPEDTSPSPTTPMGTSPEATTPGPTPSTPSTSPSESPSPSTPSESPATTPPSRPDPAASLLTSEEMPKVNDSGTSWTSTGTEDGEGASPASVCQASDLRSLGAVAVARRNFVWGSDAQVAGASVVAVFGSTKEARAASRTYATWLSDCAWGSPHGPNDISVSSGVARWWWIGRELSDGSGEMEIVGLVRRGRAVSVIVWHQAGQDLNDESDPMEPALRAAWNRLSDYTTG